MRGRAKVITSAAAIALWAAVAEAAPVVERLEPAVVAPHTAFSLTVHGSGFSDGARVFVEAATQGRFLSYRAVEVSESTCTIRLPLGFGPRPAERRVYVQAADGRMSNPLVLTIGKPPADSERTASEVPAEAVQEGQPMEQAEEEAQDVQGEQAESIPRITELRPASIPAGRPLVLEVYGVNFSEGAEVMVTANLYAGSSRLPEYSLRAFPTEYVDPELLEVEFDRGFYPIPGIRDVVVQNPSSGRSAPVPLTIRVEEKR